MKTINTINEEVITMGEYKAFGIFKRDVKFIVTADLPIEMLDVFQSIQSDEKNVVAIHTGIKDVIRQALKLRNKAKKVDKFVDRLGALGTQKIFIFLTEYIQEVADEKKK